MLRTLLSLLELGSPTAWIGKCERKGIKCEKKGKLKLSRELTLGQKV
jgi:hypothetical protein